MDNKYQRGKIYKLVSSETDKIYIGSTIQTLKRRKSQHKCKPCKSRELTCFDDFDIILIKEFPCNSRKELEREEGCIIKQNLDICVNQQIAGRTKKEHYKDNVKKINITHIKWCKNNKDKVKEYKKFYKLKNKDKIKDYYIKNKNDLNEKNKNRYRYKISWGGNSIHNNNLLKISLDLFI